MILHEPPCSTTPPPPHAHTHMQEARIQVVQEITRELSHEKYHDTPAVQSRLDNVNVYLQLYA